MRKNFPTIQIAALAIAGCASFSLHAQTTSDIADQELQRQQQRERSRAEQTEQRPDVRLMQAEPGSTTRYPERESPCSVVHSITLQGELGADFKWALAAGNDAIGRCLGSAGMNVLIGKIQNAIIARGFVTTRVLAPPQDLQSGVLALALVPGRLHAIRFADASAHPVSWNALPVRPGDVLNLRDIEQGLENFKRVPTADADIQIAPAEQVGESDLLVQWRQERRVRGAVSVDDSGSRSTGRYQGGVTLSVDNPLGLHDLFYVTLNHHLSRTPASGGSGTRGTTVHYSLPVRYWLLSLQSNDYRYRQTVAGATQDYVYSGTSTSSEVKLSRLVYRDGARKTTLSLQGFQRLSRNFIEDTEVEVQRRRTGGYVLALAHKEFFQAATLDAGVSYKHGTGAFGSLHAPEEAFGEGTSRPVLISADLALAVPIGKRLQYLAAWRAQWNRTPLVPQDRFSIGGRYTVRGFDGESSLAAERGSLLRNDLTWSAFSNGKLYAGIDAGRVGGPGRERLRGGWLAGAALGVRGLVSGLQYDISLGKPLHKPDGFHTAAYARTFSLNYGF